MTTFSADDFAQAWTAAWNRRDLDAILSHFDDAAVFESPKAVQLAGKPRLAGKPALRAYWETALARITTLRFALDGVLWDAGQRTLAIRYRATLGETTTHAIELLTFGEDGRVIRGGGYYGAPIEA